MGRLTGWLLGLGLLLVGGCGRGDPCWDTIAELCAEACSCTGEPCVFSEQGTLITVTVQTESDCQRTVGDVACGNAAFDYRACQQNLEGGTCWDDGQGEKRYQEPAGCELPEG